MIARDAEPIGHRPVYKPIDVSGRKPRKRFITREEVLDNLEPRPDPAFYDQDPYTGNWHLKE